MPSYDENKLTRLSALRQLAERAKEEFASADDLTAVSGDVSTAKENISSLTDGMSALETSVSALEDAGYQVNVIEEITVNDTKVEPVGKTVKLTIPETLSALTNDAGFLTDAEIEEKITTETEKNAVAISALETLVGEESVSEQIADAVREATTSLTSAITEVEETTTASIAEVESNANEAISAVEKKINVIEDVETGDVYTMQLEAGLLVLDDGKDEELV